MLIDKFISLNIGFHINLNNIGMEIIDGKQIAQKIIEELKKQPNRIKFSRLFWLAAIRSQSFKAKKKLPKNWGDFRIYEFSAELNNDDLRKEVGKIALLKKSAE